jgi:hypothetical protein
VQFHITYLAWFILKRRTRVRHSKEFMATIGYIVSLCEALAGLYPAKARIHPFGQPNSTIVWICTQTICM